MSALIFTKLKKTKCFIMNKYVPVNNFKENSQLNQSINGYSML